MSRSAEIELDWADGSYLFALRIGQLAELQEKCDAGPWYIRWALQAAILSSDVGMAPPRDTSAAYVREPLRLGLIGGGMEAVAARKLVDRYVSEGQLAENMAAAFSVLSVAIQGVPDDEPEKPGAGGGMEAPPSREESSASPNSSGQAPQSD